MPVEGKSMGNINTAEGKTMEGKESNFRRGRETPTIPTPSDSFSSEDEDDVLPPPRVPRSTGTPVQPQDSSDDEDLNETLSPRVCVPPRQKNQHEITLQNARLRKEAKMKAELIKKKHQRDKEIQRLFDRQKARDEAKKMAEKREKEEKREEKKDEENVEGRKKENSGKVENKTKNNTSQKNNSNRQTNRRVGGGRNQSPRIHRGDSSLNAKTMISGVALPTTIVGETKELYSDTDSLTDSLNSTSMMTDEVDDVITLARECCKDCTSLIQSGKKKIKTLPELLQSLNALMLDLNNQSENLSDLTICSQPKVTLNIEQLQHVLNETSALLSRVSGSRRLNRIDLPGVHSLNRKFRNKISRAARSVDNCKHALVTSVLMVMSLSGGNGVGGGIVGSGTPNDMRTGDDRLGSESRRNKKNRRQRNRRIYQAAEEKCMLADRFFSGLGVDQNMRLAHRNYLLAAEAGLVRAMNCVGCMYSRGLGVPGNPDLAAKWFGASASENDPEGMYHLAILMDDRISTNRRRLLNHNSGGRDEAYRTSVVKTMREIERLLTESSNLGHAGAMNALGSLYEHSDSVGTAGITRDFNKAMHWYKKSAEMDYPVAQNNMGSFCYVGKPPMKGPDYEQARMWFERAAEQCDPVALNNLGICYELGRGGVAQDLAKASSLYARSAYHGNPSAMNNWGFMLVKRAESMGASANSASFRRAALLFRCAVQTDGGWPDEDEDGELLSDGHLSNNDFSHMFGGAGSSSSSSYHSYSSHSTTHTRRGSSTMTAMERRHRRTELRQTNADACFNLATLYEAGYGVERDLQAAFS
jgi:TPR repeat protein